MYKIYLNSLFLSVLYALSCPATAVTSYTQKPWLRMSLSIKDMKSDPKGRFIAFIDELDSHLYVLDLVSKDIFKVSKATSVGLSYAWSQDGFHLLYTEQWKNSQNKVTSSIFAFDAWAHQSSKLKSFSGESSYLNIDPKTQNLHYFDRQGSLRSHAIIPAHLSKQRSQRSSSKDHLWFVTTNTVYWVTNNGYFLQKISSESNPIESFDITQDGQGITWNTQQGHIFVSEKGKNPVFVDYGRYPKWHPKRRILLYSGARMIGQSIHSYDLKIFDLKGESRWLTNSPKSDERLPQWLAVSNKILYTIDKTTDIFVLSFKQTTEVSNGSTP